jgi:hypothetical protein
VGHEERGALTLIGVLDGPEACLEPLRRNELMRSHARRMSSRYVAIVARLRMSRHNP